MFPNPLFGRDVGQANHALGNVHAFLQGGDRHTRCVERLGFRVPGWLLILTLVYGGSPAQHQCRPRHVTHEFAVHEVTNAVTFRDFPDVLGMEIPLFEDGLHFVFLTLGHHNEHALLGFTKQNFEGLHVLLAQGHAIQMDVHAHFTRCAHFRRRTRDPRCAHVLHADDSGGFGQFQCGFKQQLFLEWVSHLHRRQVVCTLLCDVLGGKRSTLDAVLACGRTHDVNRIAGTGRGGGNDFVGLEDAYWHRVDEWIDLVTRIKKDFPTHDGHAKAVAVIANAFHHPFQQPLGARVAQITKAKAVQLGNGAGSHGEDVPVDAAHPGCRALIGLNGRGVIVAFNLECTPQSVADVHDACVLFTCFHQHVRTFFGQRFQPLDGVFVGTVLTPHHRIHTHFREVGGAT